MSEDFKLNVRNAPFKRFEKLISPGFGTHTIVKVKKTPQGTQYTLKKVKWSRYKLINKIIKLWLKIKYI